MSANSCAAPVPRDQHPPGAAGRERRCQYFSANPISLSPSYLPYYDPISPYLTPISPYCLPDPYLPQRFRIVFDFVQKLFEFVSRCLGRCREFVVETQAHDFKVFCFSRSGNNICPLYAAPARGTRASVDAPISCPVNPSTGIGSFPEELSARGCAWVGTSGVIPRGCS